MDELQDAILSDVARDDVVVLIPRWEPTSLDDGLRWAQLSVYEGWYVTHLIGRSTKPVTLWFKIWELGDDEPHLGRSEDDEDRSASSRERDLVVPICLMR